MMSVGCWRKECWVLTLWVLNLVRWVLGAACVMQRTTDYLPFPHFSPLIFLP
jgi:hypothetical protein